MFNFMIGITLIIINNRFLGLPIYFEVGVLFFIIIGITFIYVDIIKDHKKNEILKGL